jgi:hypothetical protein
LRFGAIAMRPAQAFEVNDPAVREMCAADAGFGYELTRRFLLAVVNRLQATRTRSSDSGPFRQGLWRTLSRTWAATSSGSPSSMPVSMPWTSAAISSSGRRKTLSRSR